MTPTNPLDLLNALADSEVWPILQVGMHVAFFLLIFYLLKLIFDFRKSTVLRHLSSLKKSYRIPFIGLTLLFVSMLLYQASWQLTGVFRPQFIGFMQAYDRRHFNPAHRIHRGRILDRRGEVLAYSGEHRGQVHRLYPYGPAFAHVVGYSDPKFGASGMEAAANVHLNGGESDNLAAWSELGRRLVTQGKNPQGLDLVLTLDAELQLTAVRLMGKHRGAVVLLRPDDGAIRVLASTPAYDPNRISSALFRDKLPGAPLLNRATQGLYPPGSTFKVVLAAQALDAGFKGTLHCPANGFTTSSHYRKIRDHEYYTARNSGKTWKGHGNLNLANALAKSSNVFFAQLGVAYGHDAFQDSARRFWFNRQIRLHQSPYGTRAMHTGRIPLIKSSDQYGLAQSSIGQGPILATPAHMALITAAVANRGVAMTPRLVVSDPPTPLARFMTASSAGRLSRMMRLVVTDGTGRGVDTEELAIAGKTGTAQNPKGASHSWFIGFAPADRPKLAVAVMVEHGGYGSKTAAPIARDLLLRAQALGLLN